MSGYLEAKCAWCEKEETFSGPDPEGDYHRAEWIQLQDYQDEDMDFCCRDCLKSWLI